MNEYFMNATLFDENNLLESDKEDNNNTLTDQFTEDQLLTYKESPNINIGEIAKTFENLVVKQSKVLLAEVGQSLKAAEGSPIQGIDRLANNSQFSTLLVSEGNLSNNLSGTPTHKKRARELDSPTTDPLPKKPKKIVMKPLQDAPAARPNHHLVLLVPDLEEVNLFSTNHEKKLKASVDKATRLEPNPEVKFEWTGPDRGRYKFVCSNETAKEWAMAVVPKLTDLWVDAKIKAVDLGIVPRIVKASITFNNKAPNMVDLFEGIDNKNPTLDTLHWRVYKQQKVQGSKTIAFIGIDEASVKPLKDLGFRPYFEGGRIKITVSEDNNNN